MTSHWYPAKAQSAHSSCARIPIQDEWFEAYEITPRLFVFYEPGHYEETLVNLVVGEKTAALIDTGCGIGNLHEAVREVTDKPLLVINTHTHTDHVAGNWQFDDIAMFDHPAARRVAATGISKQALQTDLLADGLVSRPWPSGFDPRERSLPPFAVSRWLQDGDLIDLGGRDLEVIYTPGEAVDHICLLDRADRVLFSGDIVLNGPVWTHLEGGSLPDLITSYERLMGFFGEFDHLMPSHNEPWLEKTLLPATLAGARQVTSGQAPFREQIDPWNRRLRQYAFDGFQILTRHSDDGAVSGDRA